MYRKMLKEAESKGLTSEKLMWENIEDLEDVLCQVKEYDPKMYWKFIRKTHSRIHKGHYTEEFALHDVEHMKPLGQFWSMAQIEEVMKKYSFPNEVNKYDAFVALNSFKNDLNGELPDEQIIKIAIVFWFHDKDYPTPTKVWDYQCMIWDKKK